MPDYPPLSQLPGFMAAPQPGTPEFKDFVARVFSDPSANAAFMQHVARLASTHVTHSTPSSEWALEKADVHAR